MKCPACGSELRMTERKGVEIDYCSACRGVWLDRGELDKLLERASREQSSRERHEDDDGEEPREDPPRRHDSPPKHAEHNPKKRESFWSELFDFG